MSEPLIAKWSRIERALEARIQALEGIVLKAIAEHDSIAETEGTAFMAMSPAGGWRCGCAEFCIPARAAIAKAEGR